MPKLESLVPPFPNCSWECHTCQHVWHTFLRDGPPVVCPKCSSGDISGGPEYHGGPHDSDESTIEF